jgi:hypothetical protein
VSEEEIRDRIMRQETRFESFLDRYERDRVEAHAWRAAANDKLDRIASIIEQGKGIARAAGFGRWVLIFLASIAGALGLPKVAMWLGVASGK